MKTEDIIKKLGIEPVSSNYRGWLYQESDLDRIVAELSAEINRLNIENQTMYDTEGKQFALMKEGYETQIEVMRDALEELACLGNGDRHGNSIGNSIAIKALSQSSPLAALEEVRKQAKLEGKIEALEEAIARLNISHPSIRHYGNITAEGAGIVRARNELRRMANELKGVVTG